MNEEDLEELSRLTAEQEALNERVQRAYESRGIPSNVAAFVPLVAVEGQGSELEALAADAESLRERTAAFFRRVGPAD
ncbi:MAG: hypothetical protein CMH83_19020 [Nocardioides sp.]|nr:hypothetical protein [Nocardioides sp.]